MDEPQHGKIGVGFVTIGVVGGGLAGNMVAALLAKLGFSVTVFEKRKDERKEDHDSTSLSAFGTSTSAVKRSVNLALSYRGQCALKELGLLDDAMKHAIRMPCRIIHSVDGSVTEQAYGKSDEAIWSVSRESLNHLLLKASEKSSRVLVKFGYTLLSADAKTGHCTFQRNDNNNVEAYTFDLVIGADGAYSNVRESMLKQGRVNFSRSYIAHGYKELTIPPVTKSTADGKTFAAYAVPNYHGLHIWPRGRFMLIALPNPDRSFTATLFAPYKGPDGFDSVDPQNPAEIRKYFTTHFPDVLPLMPNLTEDYQQNPVGSLLTVRVNPWNHGKLLLLGDAAHAVVPFYGQGMNAAFEDGLRFYQLVKKAMDDASGKDGGSSAAGGGPSSSAVGDGKLNLTALAETFSQDRIPATDALADLCIEHYDDMASNTASTWYLWRKRLEALLHYAQPRWFMPMYSMIAFNDIPYHEAVIRAARQEVIINRLAIMHACSVGAGVVIGMTVAWRRWYK